MYVFLYQSYVLVWIKQIPGGNTFCQWLFLLADYLYLYCKYKYGEYKNEKELSQKCHFITSFFEQ